MGSHAISQIGGNHVVNQEIFPSVIEAVTDAICSNADLSATVPITITVTQPDVPRTLTWSFDSHAQITAFILKFNFINARGIPTIETFTEASGWSGETSNAVARINSIKLISRTGTGTGDTLDIGTGSKIGTSMPISSIVKITKNTSDLASYTAETVYDTIDLSTGGAITTGDDFNIWYVVDNGQAEIQLMGRSEKVAYSLNGAVHDQISATKFLALAGIASSITVECHATVSLSVAIYDDDGSAGAPGTLLASTSSPVICSIGENVIPLDNKALLLPGNYWIAIKPSNTSKVASALTDSDAYALAAKYVSATYEDAWPETMPSMTSSVYAMAVSAFGLKS